MRHGRNMSEPPADLSLLSNIDHYNAQAKYMVRTTQHRNNKEARRHFFKRPNEKAQITPKKTLPLLRLSNHEGELSLVKLRAERDSEQDHGSQLRGKISHLQHEKEHCQQVVIRARRKYNSIVEVRTQALHHRQQIEQVALILMQRKELLRRTNEQFLSQVKDRVSSERELHKSRMSSWKGRISTEVSAIRHQSKDNCKIIAKNQRLQEAKKRELASQVRKQHQRLTQQKRSIGEQQRSRSHSNRQQQVMKQWDRTCGYLQKKNQKLYKRLLTQFDEYKKAAEEATRQLDQMSNILSLKVRKRGGCSNLQDNMSSCSYYTSHTFLTKS